MKLNKSKPVIVGVVGHIQPEKLSEFKNTIENLSYFRLIRFEESDSKLWIVSREDSS